MARTRPLTHSSAKYSANRRLSSHHTILLGDWSLVVLGDVLIVVEGNGKASAEELLKVAQSLQTSSPAHDISLDWSAIRAQRCVGALAS